MALLETLKDDFDFGGVDSGKWSTWGSTATVGTTNLMLEMTSTLAANYGGTLSLVTYNLTGSYAFAQLVDAGNQALTSLEVYPVELSSGTTALSVMINLNTVYARKKVAGVYSTVGVGIAYNSTTMKYFRVRESAGSTYWEYAADPSGSWTEITPHVANPITVTALTAGQTIGTWQAEASISTVKFDNFNFIPGETTFTWQGRSWNKRIHAGAPANNQTWASANVGTPDASDYLTLSLTNPGSAPVGCEIYTAQRGFGYGTYTAVYATRLDNIDPASCFGGMFTFDFTAPPDYREIDMGEVRDYLQQSTKNILYNHAWNNGGSIGWITDPGVYTSDVVQTHQCVWTPTKICFKTFVGEGTGGTLLNHFHQETHVPTKGLERVHFCIFVDVAITGFATVAPLDVVLRKFTFDAFAEPGNAGRHITVDNGMSRSEIAN